MSQISERQYHLIHDSYRRCMLADDFLVMFHRNFMEKSPQIPKFFADHTLQQQHRILAKSVARLVSFVDGKPQAEQDMRDTMRILHDGNLRLTPEHYAFWATALMETICTIDEACNDEVAVAWEQTISYGTGVLKKDHSLRNAAYQI
ncbi:MAG: hypothetical protein CMJ46_12130 [Planctomyces sp.]|nr:hypothetical protein [Planctomyces sp.]